MLIDAIERNAEVALLSQLEDVNSHKSFLRGMVSINRQRLKTASHDEILLALKPALQEATEAKIFFPSNGYIYVAWSGMLKQIYESISSIVKEKLAKTDVPQSEPITIFLDPMVMGDELRISLTRQLALNGKMSDGTSRLVAEKMPENIMLKQDSFSATPGQALHYKKQLEKRGSRKQLSVLIVEDHPFLRRLMHEMLKSEHNVLAASSAEDGWQLYLEHVPDIIFLDIELTDADGHTLASKIKEIDPDVHIVMVTASHYMQDVQIAKKNRVDGFVLKPFNKSKIDTCIQNYLAQV